MSTVGLILAAGRGERLGGELPKQYRTISGQTLLSHSLRAFTNHPEIDAVKVAIHPDDQALYKQAAQNYNLLEPVMGGETRQQTVRLGLESLIGETGVAQPVLRVLIHDSARPLPPDAMITELVNALREWDGAIPVLPVTDTLKSVSGGQVKSTVPRAGLWRAQTPQAFQFDKILAAHQAASGHEMTDDAAVAEAQGLALLAVQGSENNIKVTTEEDLHRVGALLASTRSFRVGSGYDVHRFGIGDQIMLCGVAIPHDQGLVGHSDADVALHALTDALLGAAAKGDIGIHFPPSDPQWRNADSRLFIEQALSLISSDGGRIENVDVTLICEQPYIKPHRERMIARLMEMLHLDANRVNLKATTTEGLGFTGRGEGIAAQASVLVSFPNGNARP